MSVQDALLTLPAPAQRRVEATGVKDPVARVLLDTPLPHLDRLFDYAIPAQWDEKAQPGTRVAVRLAGQEAYGWIWERAAETSHAGTLAPLRRVVSDLPVLPEASRRLIEALAARSAGSRPDLVRLAVPPRHAATEASERDWGLAHPTPAGGRESGVAAPDPLRDAVPDSGNTSGPDPQPDAPPEAGPDEGPHGSAEPSPPAPDAAKAGDGVGHEESGEASSSGQAQPGEMPDAAQLTPAQTAGLEEALSTWQPYDGAAPFLHALASGGGPRAVWGALPGREGKVAPWQRLVAQAIAVTLRGGRQALIVVATTAQAERLAAVLREDLAPVLRECGYEEAVARSSGGVGVLSAEHGPARRYRVFTGALLGHLPVIVGTRAAAFAPLARLGLAIMWDDGDSRLDEPHAPYLHARTVLAVRCGLEGAGLLLAGYGRSVEAQSYVEHHWAGEITAPRELRRAVLPRIEVPGPTDLEAEGPSGRARIPSLAHRLLRQALESGPVLVQVARAGYAPVVACERCREAVRCRSCGGPALMGRGREVRCGWCARPIREWACPTCGGARMRMASVGSARTGEELGRSFSGVPVVVSGARDDHGVIESVDEMPRLVVATPGAEPVARGGYAAALLLDGGVMSSRPELGASSQALRRWAGAVALVRAQGRVMLLGWPAHEVAQALLRWDHEGFARRELAERAELGLPPALRCARIDGPRRAVEGLVEQARGAGWDVLGPVEVPAAAGPSGRASARSGTTSLQTAKGGVPAEGSAGWGPGGAGRTPGGSGAGGAGAPVTVRALLRTEPARGKELAAWLQVRARERSARREDPLRIELDPTALW